MKYLLLIICMAYCHAWAYSSDLEARVLSIYSADKQNESFQAGTKLKVLVYINGGIAPFVVYWNGKHLGTSNKRMIRLSLTAAEENGNHNIPVSIIDAQQKQSECIASYRIGSDLTEESDDWGDPEESESSGDLAALMDSGDDWGDDDAEEEDVADPYLTSGAAVYPWTENQSRSIMNTMLPSAVAIGKGEWYYRILHIARERIDDEPATSFIGLDDNIKIGFQVSYGIADNFDVNVQRTNGRSLQVNLNRSDATKMDYYDIIFRYQFMKRRAGGMMDAAVHIGPTLMLRNTGSGEESLNLGLVCERNFLKDRLRLGVGVAYASLSTYERTVGKGPDTKLTPDEYSALRSAGSPVPAEVEEHTLAIPLLAKYALTKKQQIFAEVIVPVDGYETRAGPSISCRISP